MKRYSVPFWAYNPCIHNLTSTSATLILGNLIASKACDSACDLACDSQANVPKVGAQVMIRAFVREFAVFQLSDLELLQTD